MKSSTQKPRRQRAHKRNIEKGVKNFWGGVLLVGLFSVLLMYVALR